jgi:hypothetical protein
VWHYWEHLGKEVGNLRNILGMCWEHGEDPLGIVWEHIGNIKNSKPFYPFTKEK